MPTRRSGSGPALTGPPPKQPGRTDQNHQGRPHSSTSARIPRVLGSAKPRTTPTDALAYGIAVVTIAALLIVGCIVLTLGWPS
jgi:hypothetical protein